MNIIWRRTPCPSGGGAEAWYTVFNIESMNEFNGSRCRNGAESLDDDELEFVIGYANSRQSAIDAGTI